jgi:hypothetical protein
MFAADGKLLTPVSILGGDHPFGTQSTIRTEIPADDERPGEGMFSTMWGFPNNPYHFPLCDRVLYNNKNDGIGVSSVGTVKGMHSEE